MAPSWLLARALVRAVRRRSRSARFLRSAPSSPSTPASRSSISTSTISSTDAIADARRAIVGFAGRRDALDRGSSAWTVMPIGLVPAHRNSVKEPAMPSLPNFKLSLPTPHLNLGFGGRATGNVVGLDIQPGFVAAVKASVNGSIVAEQAACLPLASDTVREGEVMDE